MSICSSFPENSEAEKLSGFDELLKCYQEEIDNLTRRARYAPFPLYRPPLLMHDHSFEALHPFLMRSYWCAPPCRASDAAFHTVYKDLYAAPDPAPLLTALLQDKQRLSPLELELSR
jgi:hypothetical protein